MLNLREFGMTLPPGLEHEVCRGRDFWVNRPDGCFAVEPRLGTEVISVTSVSQGYLPSCRNAEAFLPCESARKMRR
jgi:hypothetical protein